MTATSANAVFVCFDTVPNNTQATAQPLVSNTADWNSASCRLSADVGMGSLAAPAGGVGDVDYFSLVLPAGCIVTAITTPLSPFSSAPDTLLGGLDAALAPYGTNDDAGTDSNGAGTRRGSAIRFLTTAAGTHYMRVTGFNDTGFAGQHSQAGDYLLTISVTPEPATLGLLLGGLVFFARRRK